MREKVCKIESPTSKIPRKKATTTAYFPSISYYASYKEIEEAIKPWGKIEAVLKGTINTMFIVSFKKDIQIQTTEKYPYHHPFPIPNPCNSALGDTPFDLRGMYSKNGCSFDNLILSEKLMAFSLKRFIKNRHDWDPAINRATNPSEIAKLKKLDHSKKKEKLLKLLKDSGLGLIEKGVARYFKNSTQLKNPSIEAIIQNYKSFSQNYKSFSWEVIHRAK